MDNTFDQFDAAPAASNAFDQFDQAPQSPANAPSTPDLTSFGAQAATSQPGWLQALLGAKSGTQNDVSDQRAAVEFMNSPEGQRGLISPETVQTGLGAIGQIGATSPQDLQSVPGQDALNRALAERISGATSPSFIGQAPQFFNPGVRAMYAADMIDPAATQLADAYKAGQAGDTAEAVYKGAGGTIDALMAAFLAKDVIPKAGEAASTEAPIEKPPVQPEAPPPVRPGTTAADVSQAVERMATNEDADAANAKLAQSNEPPVPAPEDATGPPPKVREALSLDELRLMRERNDLQLQNELSKRVTGATHPAVDDRISQINDELDNIANSELQSGHGEPVPAVDLSKLPDQESAPQESLQPEQPSVTIPAEDAKYAGTSPEFQARNAKAGQSDAPPVQPASVGPSGADRTGVPERPGSGTRNEAFTELYGEGAVPSGTGVDTAQLLDNARANIRSGAADPYSILSRTRAKGIANAEEYATLAAEHERLVNDAVAKQKANALDAPQAAKAAEDFANAIQPHKTAASDLMRLFQGDVNYDMSTPFGMDQYMKSEIGRTPTMAERPKFNRMSNDIGRAQTEVQQAVTRSDARVQSRYAKVRDIPMEEAASRVREWLKDCIV